ncbi:MAG: heme-copper oxidase subunit III, partial [Calditrichaeota bacterium]
MYNDAVVAPEKPVKGVDSGGGGNRNGWNEGGYGGDDPWKSPSAPSINKAIFGLLMFIATEIMIFAGLISAFIVVKANAGQWPPPDQPRLPVAVTGVNTFFLLLSGVTVYLAVRAIRREAPVAFKRWLTLTGILGTLFLAIQGYEWARLLGYGLTMSSSLYGATFYTLIGAHGLHVLAAVGVLLFVLSRAFRGRYSPANYNGVVLCQIYWFFVVGIWPVLYLLVYF